MNNSEFEALKSSLDQFRLDVIKAIAEIDVEIDALQQAIEEGKSVTPDRLKQLRNESRNRLSRFMNFHAERIGPPHP